MRSRPPIQLGSSSTLAGLLCSRCLLRLRNELPRASRHGLSTTAASKAASQFAPRKSFAMREYFLPNGFMARPNWPEGWTARSKDASVDAKAIEEDIASASSKHERHMASQERNWSSSRPATKASATPDISVDIPPDASSRLSTLSASLPTRSLRRTLSTYLSLSKPRLSFLIVLTTTAAYSLYPVPALFLPSTTASPSLSALTLLYLTSGTALSCASANALNMLFEPAHDAKMSRTRNRPLVRKLLSPRAAALFALATGAAGIALLIYGVNPTVAFLSALNIALYAAVYTPMKRLSVLNTWVGAVVGGIPPLMGWAAAAGQNATGSGAWHELLLSPTAAGGWLLAALLYAWQFPHFNALSWSIRDEYRLAGYRMLAWTNPRANARVALRYALLLFPICAALTWVGVTDRAFVVTSGIANAWMLREAWRFWRHQGAKGSARGLFWASVWHLPVVMALAMLHKKGLWEGLWSRAAAVTAGRELVDEDENITDDDPAAVADLGEQE